MVNYFKILGVSEDATEDEIKRAYQTLKNSASNGISKNRISGYDCAYATLSDSNLRAIHLNTLNQSKEKIGKSEVGSTDSLSKNIELLDQRISDIKGEFDTPVADEYRAKLSSLHKEREEALKTLASQRTHEMQTRLKTPGVDKIINDKYDGFEREVNIEFSKKESQLKQMYKGKLLVEYIEYLPKQLELEKLMRDKRKSEEESAIQCVYIEHGAKKHR